VKFRFYNGDVLIGYSELEHDDRSMGIRIGRFYPDNGYDPIEPIYQEFTMVRSKESLGSPGSGNPDQAQSLKVRVKQLRAQIDRFDLRLETAEGRPVGTSWIHIEDASAELGDHEREVTICVDDHRTYDEFFA
jgi:hypothetical protein